MPSPGDDEKLVQIQGVLKEFEESQPGSPQAAEWRMVLKKFLHKYGFEVINKVLRNRRKKKSKGPVDKFDYSFEK